MNINQYGYNTQIEEAALQCLSSEKEREGLGRVCYKNRGFFEVQMEKQVIQAQLSGKFMHLAEGNRDYPAVGDWVYVNPDAGIIEKLIPRYSAFVRQQKSTGGKKAITESGSTTTQEQVLASNIDYCFIVTGLDGNFNEKRIERYLVLAYNSGALPIIILSKKDLCHDIDHKMALTESVAMGVPIILTSVVNSDDEGILQVKHYLKEGKTGVFLGSSGVGKSSITNVLLNQETQRVSETNEKWSKGRHTTTGAKLLFTDQGGCIIDTPGIREVGLWCDTESLSENFEEIVTLESKCYYNNCSHQGEKGCAVTEAIEKGDLSVERYERYQKLKREMAYLNKKRENAEKLKHKKKRPNQSRHQMKARIKKVYNDL